jgi:hypothetical protein
MWNGSASYLIDAQIAAPLWLSKKLHLNHVAEFKVLVTLARRFADPTEF